MNYNLKDGHSLLGRLLILHHFMQITKNQLTNDPKTNAAILSNLLTFIELNICSSYEFTYGNKLSQNAFKYDSCMLIQSINQDVSEILKNQYQTFLKTTHIQSADQIIQNHKKISNDDLITLSTYPEQYFQWQNRHIKIIERDLVYTNLNKYFNAQLVRKLIQKGSGYRY